MGDFPDITVSQSGGAGEARGEGGGLAVNFRVKWSVPRKVLVFGLFQASQSGVVSGRKLSRQSTKVFCTLPQGVGAEVKVFCTLPQGVGTEVKVFCTLPQRVGTEVKVFCTLPQGRATEPQGVGTESRRFGAMQQGLRNGV